RPRPSEEEIEAQAADDRDAWTDEELAEAEPVYNPSSPEQVRALRAKLGFSQAQFARVSGSCSTQCSNTSGDVGFGSTLAFIGRPECTPHCAEYCWRSLAIGW